jgi:hypothetical protein
MLVLLLLIAIGLIPPVLSAWLSLRAHRRIQAQFELALETSTNHRFREWMQRHPDERYVDGIGFVIGDITCQMNARSPYLRCAVNPTGPCETCRLYEGKPY